eukprot:RCo036033
MSCGGSAFRPAATCSERLPARAIIAMLVPLLLCCPGEWGVVAEEVDRLSRTIAVSPERDVVNACYHARERGQQQQQKKKGRQPEADSSPLRSSRVSNAAWTPSVGGSAGGASSRSDLSLKNLSAAAAHSAVAPQSTAVQLMWQRVVPTAPFTPSRFGHCSVTFGDVLLVIAGVSARGTLNDVWWSHDGLEWHQSTPSAPFARRYNLGCAVFGSEVVVVGGLNYSMELSDFVVLGDVWSSS